MDRRGGMTLSSVIPLSVKTRTILPSRPGVARPLRAAALQGGGQAGAPSASPLTAASTMAALRHLGTILCVVVILAASMLSSGAAHAEQELSATRRPNDLSVPPFAAFVTEASKRFGVPEHWIRAVMHVESGANQRAQSQKGAMGLMQIMPKTRTELRARYGLGADSYDPRDNIWLVLHTSANSTIATARQGSSPPTMQDLDATNVIWGTSRPLPDETQAYVATLAPIINHARTNVQLGAVTRSFAWASSSLFAARSAGISPDGSSRADMRQNRTSRAHGTVDLSALVPHSRNLLVHLTGEMRSR